jgi:hypothetical protein
MKFTRFQYYWKVVDVPRDITIVHSYWAHKLANKVTNKWPPNSPRRALHLYERRLATTMCNMSHAKSSSLPS